MTEEVVRLLIAHGAIAFLWGFRVWNMSDVPPGEMAELRGKFGSLPVERRPDVLEDNRPGPLARRMALFVAFVCGSFLLSVTLHPAWAILALVAIVMMVETVRRAQQKIYRDNLEACKRWLAIETPHQP